MMRILAAVAAVLLAGCSSTSDGGPSGQDFRSRLAYLFDQYNLALRDQDIVRVEVVTSDLKRLAAVNFEALLTCLSSTVPQEKADAAFALGFSKNRGAITPLTEAATKAEDPAARANAIASLGMLGFEDVPIEAFRRGLEDSEANVRVAALFGL